MWEVAQKLSHGVGIFVVPGNGSCIPYMTMTCVMCDIRRCRGNSLFCIM